MDEATRILLALLGAYTLLRGTARLRATWREIPSEPRLLWLVVLATAAAGAFAHAYALSVAAPVGPGAYASGVPLILGAAAVSLPRSHRL